MLGGKFNLGALMKGAGKLQAMVEQSQQELANTELVGEAGAGLVRVIMTAKYDVKQVHLEDELLQEPKEVIQDLIAAAFNSVNQKAEEANKQAMMSASRILGDFTTGDK